ncbi:family 43 glycosylhydrolase [Pelagicoccus sp. SDUM812005]|uniref:family 43 glycosylhydrolase n=1 Tax=Pelagicoccus sp. SDUM812005 TaxID=3041257 RepID=UPI00280F4163|nr:family 43 glycosylhydrolase [Pelagicoccus sp. SDUM812005]MDQ8179197.1 family 43 glycosylhydrolase [Pelagicoccus sp. SDUM812005]
MTVPPLPSAPISIDALQAHGVTDPQLRIFNNKAYLYASHDHAPTNTRFVMPDWQLWSSEDLLNWQYETTLSPTHTHIGKPFDGCWAGDAICKDGTYYWCFSVVDQRTGLHEIGLVSAPTPTGPWSDPVGGPWIKGDAADTHVYDPGFLQLEDGTVYIVFGVWDYYIARVADDMSGLAETPRKIEIRDPAGPYGSGKTDDKPFLHQRGDTFYLSWGCFYAVSKYLYGPYQYKGCLVDESNMAPSFRERTWPHGPQQGRHGSFCDWKGQSYFMYCDMSFSGNRYYRGSWISYVHYRANGEIAPIEISADAVGRYSAAKAICPANYSEASGIQKVENPDGSFSIRALQADASLHFPNITGLQSASVVATLRFNRVSQTQTLQISNGKSHPGDTIPVSAPEIRYPIASFDSEAGLRLSFHGPIDPSLQLDSITLTDA